MIGQTACFTGHRVIPPQELPALQAGLERALTALIAKGYRFFAAGGALGFDTLAAEAVLRMRSVHPQLRLILVLPCPEQADRWSQADRARYAHILQQADKTVYVSERYTRACMFKRNRHLVNHSSVCITYLRRARGGTFYTAQYARERGVSLLEL